MKKIAPFIFLLVFGCQTVAKKQSAAPAPESYRNELLKSQSISKENPNLAIARLNQLLSSNSENSLSDDALYLMGDLLFKTGNLKAAERSFTQILDSRYASPLDGKALLYKARIARQSDQNSVLKSLRYVDYNQLQDQSSLEKIERIRAPIFLKSELYKKYLKSASTILRLTQDNEVAAATRRQAHDVLKIKLSGSQSKTVLTDPELSIFHAQAALNLAEYHFNNDQPEQGMNVLEQNIQKLDAPIYKSKRDELIMRGQLYLTSNPSVIGVILPLTGKYQSVGHQILNGLQFSFDIWGRRAGQNFQFAILDSEGDPDQVSLAFNELIKKDKPIAIVGGLVSKTAEVLLEKADKFRVPTLVLSQKEGLTQNSKYGFQAYQSLESYSAFVAAIAFKDAGYTKIAIMESEQAFSKRYSQAFQKEFTALGGEITDIVEYDLSKRKALPNAVKQIVKLVSTGDRKEEYDEAVAKWRLSSRSRGQGGIPEIEEVLKPLIDFDALFIADGAKNGGLIASTLAYFDVEDLPLIGTHLWNDNDLIERGQRFVENAMFADSYHKPLLQSSKCGLTYVQKFEEPIGNYSFSGIKAGTILNSSYKAFNIETRKDLLSALMRTSTLTDACIPKGLIREAHNFTSSLSPLTVINKAIVPLTADNIVRKTDEEPVN